MKKLLIFLVIMIFVSSKAIENDNEGTLVSVCHSGKCFTFMSNDNSFIDEDDLLDDDLLSITLIKTILRLAKAKQKIMIKDIMRVTMISRIKIKKYLKILVDHKYLQIHGQGETAWYTFRRVR